MAFDQNKPVTNGPLSSAEIRNNFYHVKQAINKEHVWDDSDPANIVHRLDQIRSTFTGSTQRDTELGGYDYTTGSGEFAAYKNHVRNGITANTYSLKSLLQELVNRSHRHEVERILSNCNCNCCNCGGA